MKINCFFTEINDNYASRILGIVLVDTWNLVVLIYLFAVLEFMFTLLVVEFEGQKQNNE